jgi:hypothetical protein
MLARAGCCHVRRGRGNILFVAPHGGRRPPADPTSPRDRKVNDLYTADLTAQLAAALDASALINDQRDRNELDLNRIGQVKRQARWFLDLLLNELGDLLIQHERVQVLLVHGWNVVQPKCDLGVGAVEDAGGLRAVGNAAISVDDCYWRTRASSFRAACAAVGIVTVVGERYPAAHRNNLLQIFTTRFTNTGDRHLGQLAQWAGARRLNAIQLELGIPLRWPGPLRDKLQAAAVHAFGPGPVPTAALASPAPRPSVRPEPFAFHFHDPRRALTAFASISPMPSSTAGRLLLFLGGQEIALFTGEDAGHHRAVGGLVFERSGDDFNLHFSGQASRVTDATLYLDLEAALAASRLTDVRLDLRYESLAPTDSREPRLGRFAGTVSVDGQRLTVAALGFLDPTAASRGPGGHTARAHLAAAFDDQTAISLRAYDRERVLAGIISSSAGVERSPCGELVAVSDGDLYMPRSFRLALDRDCPPIVARPLARMPILRPLGNGAYARVTFGPAQFDWGGQLGWGVYEYGRRVEGTRTRKHAPVDAP